MAHYKMLDGNAAAVEATRMARVKYISAYPITPQSTIAEKLSELVAKGEMDAEYVRVESEHSALSCAMGAQLTGIRTATATASVGLALMHEILNVVSGCRVPIVMPVVNRSLASPWSLWCDHQDSMAERDSGWIQLYCENVQDVFDTMLMAYRIAEHPEILTPVMVCLDGFFLSHSMQKLILPEQYEVDAFVGEYKHHNVKLDSSDPLVINPLIGSDQNTEIMYQQAVAFAKASAVMQEVFDEFYVGFGRKKELVESYRTEDAETIIVGMGSMAGTIKYVVDNLRKEGHKVGMVKVVSFRPFPATQLREALRTAKKIAVIDRSSGLGGQLAPLGVEVKAAIGSEPLLGNYVAGLAGRDINPRTILKIFDHISQAEYEQGCAVWIDCDTENAEKIREVEQYV